MYVPYLFVWIIMFKSLNVYEKSDRSYYVFFGFYIQELMV